MTAASILKHVNTPLEMMVRFRDRGMRWPLRDGDVIELWRGTDMYGTIPATLIHTLITHHLSMAHLFAHFHKAAPRSKMVSRRSRNARLFLAALALFFASCSTTSQYAIYQHPTTGDQLRCEKAPPKGGLTGVYGLIDLPLADRYNDCKSDLERQGYRHIDTIYGQQTARPEAELSHPVPAP